MRRFSTLTIFLAFLLPACGSSVPVSKVIAAKDNPVENRISAWDTATGDGGVRTKSKTVYYLIAADGSFCEVGLSTWHRVKVGESFESRHWRTED